MNKRKRTRLDAYTELQKAGVDVRKCHDLRFNAGEETFAHGVGKLAASFLGVRNGYWVNGEVECDNGGEIDVLLWGHESRSTYAVEVESNWTDETMQKKLDKYVKPYPIDDILPVEATELSANYMDALEDVSLAVGLDP